MHSKSTIANIFVRAVLNAASQRGIDQHKLLAKAGISTNVLEDSESRITRSQYSQLILCSIREMQDELFGLGSRSFRIRPGAFSMMCHATINCRTLREALKQKVRFYNLFTDKKFLEFRESGEDALIRCHSPDQQLSSEQFYLESCFVACLRWGSWMIDSHIHLSRVEFDFSEPDYQQEYDAIFSCEQVFDQKHNQIVFPRSYLDRPIIQDMETLSFFLKKLPGALLIRYKNDESLSYRVRRMLDDAEWTHKAGGAETMTESMESIATRIHMTPQTLRRRLREEGSSFRLIRENWLRDRSIYLLTRKQKSISDVSRVLGFSEPSAFHRAFKKWTGKTPAIYQSLN